MNLKSFGCSFIFGSELSDNGQLGYHATGSILLPLTGSQLTWPAHLATHLGYKYLNYSRPGSGNLQIAERVLSHLATNEPAFFVIGWTYIDRFDYVNVNVNVNDPTQQPGMKWSTLMPVDTTGVLNKYYTWSTLMPVDTTDVSNTYYKNLHSEIRDKLTTLMSIRLVIDTLKQKGCPFIMTYMDDLIFDQRWHTTPAITDLQDYIRPHMTTFEGMNFQQWSKKNGHAITDIGHPLESAHRAAGELMIKVFDTQNTIDR
jgi:hypothetical protein